MTAMDKRFQHYGETVCQFVSHATSKEKAAIRAELAAHMEDHAQALMDAGYDEDHAQNAALTAMGDPTEVGKALNKEYPLRWLVLSRISAVLLVWIVLTLLLISPTFFRVPDNLEARFSPLTCVAQSGQPVAYPDIQQDLPGGNVLSFCRVGVTPSNGLYTVYVSAVTYNKNPFYPTVDLWDGIWTFTCGGIPQEGSWSDGTFILRDVKRGDPISFHYDRDGTAFDLDIPIPWEEVPE